MGQFEADLRLIQDGVIRTYRAHLPPSIANGSSTPLVIVLPPANPADAEAIQMGFDGLTDSAHFAVVYPETKTVALGEKHELARDGEAGDEVNFINAVIADVGRRIPLDADRVFIVVLDSRAAIAQGLICENPDLVAGFVTLSQSDECATCVLAEPNKQLVLSQGFDMILTPARAWEFFDLQTR